VPHILDLVLDASSVWLDRKYEALVCILSSQYLPPKDTRLSSLRPAGIPDTQTLLLLLLLLRAHVRTHKLPYIHAHTEETTGNKATTRLVHSNRPTRGTGQRWDAEELRSR
jgi:hypothetical protein